MQIVIDIPQKVYDKVLSGDGTGTIWAGYVKNGIPLPKHHGRLIDADELYGDFIDGTEAYDCQTWSRIEIGDIIKYAPTIIKADEAED